MTNLEVVITVHYDNPSKDIYTVGVSLPIIILKYVVLLFHSTFCVFLSIRSIKIYLLLLLLLMWT